MKRKIISLILAAVMVLGIMPAGLVSFAGAGTGGSADNPYYPKSISELKTVLQEDSERYIALDRDIIFEDGADIDVFNVAGNKYLDLRGHTIKYKTFFSKSENRHYRILITTFLNVLAGASLTIDDTRGGGEIIRDRGICTAPGDGADKVFNTMNSNLTVIEVYGNLTVLNGEITAGHYLQEYYTYTAKDIHGSGSHTYKPKRVNSVICGNAVAVRGGGTFVSYGGKYNGRGKFYPRELSAETGWTSSAECAAVVADADATVTVYDGDFTGKSCANVFITDSRANISVYGGKFYAEYTGTLTLYKEIRFSDAYIIYDDLECGKIGIPLRAFSHGKGNQLLIDADGTEYVYDPEFTPDDDEAFGELGKESDGFTMTVCRNACGTAKLSVEAQEAGNAYAGTDNSVMKVFCTLEEGTFYPDGVKTLSDRMTRKYKWTLTDCDDSKKVITITTAADGFNLMSYAKEKGFEAGHSYYLKCDFSEKYSSSTISYDVSAGTEKCRIIYSGISIPDCTAAVSEDYSRSAKNGVARVRLDVEVSGTGGSTALKAKLAGSGEEYEKRITADGIYSFNIDETQIPKTGIAEFVYWAEASDSNGVAIKGAEHTLKALMLPFMTSSRSSVYSDLFGYEIIGSKESITLYSNVSGAGYTYQWRSAVISGDGSWGAYTDIPGATGADYTVSGITERRAYCVRVSYRSGADVYTQTSNVVMVTPSSALDGIYATASATKNEVSLTDTTTLSANAENAKGQVEYLWRIKDGPEGFYPGYLNDNRTSPDLVFPVASKSWAKNMKPGVYTLYCTVTDTMTSKKYNTAPITILVHREVESFKISYRGRKLKSGSTIYMSSEDDTVRLDLVPVPEYTDSVITFRSASDETAVFTEDGIISALKPGTMYLETNVYDGEKNLGALTFNVVVPVTHVVLGVKTSVIAGRDAVPPANYSVKDGYTAIRDCYWADADEDELKPLPAGSVFKRGVKYSLVFELGTQTGYSFPITSWKLDECYSEGMPLPVNDTDYIDSVAMDIEFRPAGNGSSSGYFDWYGDAFLAVQKYTRINDSRFVIDSVKLDFKAPEPGTTVTVRDLEACFSNSNYSYAYRVNNTFYTSIYDETTGNRYEEVTLEAGHQYSFNPYVVASSGNRFNDKFADEGSTITVNGDRYPVEMYGLSVLHFVWKFIPGTAKYVETESVSILFPKAGEKAPVMNESGNTYSEKMEDLGLGDACNTCTVKAVEWLSNGKYNDFLPDGSFKPDTAYSAVLTLQMSDAHKSDEYYRIRSITLNYTDAEDGTHKSENFIPSQVYDAGRETKIVIDFKPTGKIENSITVTERQTKKVKEGYTAGWGILNKYVFKLYNYGEKALTNLRVEGVDGSSPYFTAEQPETKSIAPGRYVTFNVKVEAGAEAGEYNAAYDVFFTGGDGNTYSKRVYTVLKVTDRDWYYVNGDVKLPASKTGDPLNTTKIELLHTDGKSTGKGTTVIAALVHEFSLDNVAAGTYLLRASRNDSEPIEKVVTVADDDVFVTLDFTGNGEEEADECRIYADMKTALPGDVVAVSIRIPCAESEISGVRVNYSYSGDAAEMTNPWHTGSEDELLFNTECGPLTAASGTVTVTAKDGAAVMKNHTLTAYFEIREGIDPCLVSFTVDRIEVYDASGSIIYEDGGMTAEVTVLGQGEVPGDVMKGDFDNDGAITVADALAALRIAAKIVAEDAASIATGDIDGDGHVTVADALMILRVAAKLADHL